MSLKIRGTFNVLGERYKVRLRRQKDKAYGRCYCQEGLIELDPRQSPDKMRDTLLHEVVHAIDSVDSLKLSEHQVRRMATGLRAVFTANPKFAKFVSE